VRPEGPQKPSELTQAARCDQSIRVPAIETPRFLAIGNTAPGFLAEGDDLLRRARHRLSCLGPTRSDPRPCSPGARWKKVTLDLGVPFQDLPFDAQDRSSSTQSSIAHYTQLELPTGIGID
jgi:hypothetical protein